MPIFTIAFRSKGRCTSDPRNKGSERVMQKIGMVWEGRLREDLLLSEGWRDSLIYSILARDYNS
ncbi:GNAT family N-acetyltransferase [Alkalicoccobacillus gibsonii]|uniref:GNAT family N-acetyltransferase n=1 Tax=Alkalicoccobacillus gibsonii TaxID=79881 RepID=UPI003F7BD34F